MGLELNKLTILDSKILGTSKKQLERICEYGCGAVTTKLLTKNNKEKERGRKGPTVVETEAGLLTDIGNLNYDELKFEWEREEPLVISVDDSVDLSEVDIEGASAVEIQGSNFKKNKIEKIELPVIAKINSNLKLKEVEEKGVDAINISPKFKGMKIDIHRKKPILENKTGRIRGPSTKPITIKKVYEANQKVDIPIIASGGIMTGVDAIEALIAGAKYVGVGGAIYYRGLDVFEEIEREIKTWLDIHNTSIEEIRDKSKKKKVFSHD